MFWLAMGVLFFLLFVATHILLARAGVMCVELPKLLGLAVLWLAVYGAVWAVGGGMPAGTGFWNVPLAFTSMALFFLFCLCYILECNLVPYGSPSMKILEFVNRSAGAEASHVQLKDYLTGERIVQSRLDDLVASGYIAFDGARYTLQPGGRRVARLMRAYRQLFRLEAGG
ncbi:MAG: hypothetical protein A3G34_03080 [Candidatus Lindowbacteria bacterium RIFCSPLOWO2_12_FULL_62_27]|nr:MAG: hypothetical protein A3G34_03080 [Candidatus Lindowbacteria bacterium RIFCSPLOWO2_12_FULL_62_27]OGH62228.1 MAG: hypothetical protein A3I06_05390 [Candidatus Lindowbacteria bacterium RIFCSPLOWO2_02_FULL_62_12]